MPRTNLVLNLSDKPAFLSRREQAELLRLEDVIETARSWALLEAQSLRTIRDKRLYRATHETFEQYVEQKWDISRAHAYRLCEWAATLAAVSPIGDIGPATEGAARPLYGLTPTQQRQAWKAHLKDKSEGTASLIAACETVRARIRQQQDQKAVAKVNGDSRVICADVLDGLTEIADGTVSLVLTSPPYAEQRQGQYPGVPESEYPQWMVKVMRALRPKLTPTASVSLVMRPHLVDGQVSDYCLRMRLALREDGWRECEELIWAKLDAPPLGSTQRPRRVWESIYWFSVSPRPHIDLLACGNDSERVGFEPASRFGHGGSSPIHGGQNAERVSGRARAMDIFHARVGEVEAGLDHPAMMPTSLAEQLVSTFSRPNDLVLDIFAGSGTTLIAADKLGRRCVGIEVVPRYAALIRKRLSGKDRHSAGRQR